MIIDLLVNRAMKAATSMYMNMTSLVRIIIMVARVPLVAV